MTVQDYSAEDVQQILTIALGQYDDAVGDAQLQEMAADLSIDDVALRYAMDAWRVQKLQRQKTRQRRQQFYRWEVLPYVVVNTFLIGLNVAISGTVTWAIYPLLGWGVGLLLGLTLCGCDRKRLSPVSATHEVLG